MLVFSTAEMTKRVRFIILSFIVAVTLICFNGCSSISFKDEGLSEVFGEIFDKKPRNISIEELESIETFSIITYANNNYITVTLDGYDEALASSGRDAAAEYVRTVDITDKSFSGFEDFVYLKNLKSFAASYFSFRDFDFLKNCSNISGIYLDSCYNCTDFSFLTSFEGLETLSVNDCEFSDVSFISDLKSLKSLSLSGIYMSEYPISDISFVQGLTELESLSLSSLGIVDISALENLKKLEYLNLSYNGISDVTPISELTNLTFINLTQNIISDVSSLTNYNPEKFERIMLDLNSLITDWSPLDYLGNKVQGKY